MQTVVLFLLFFLYFPLLIATIRVLRNWVAGPRDDSLYSKQLYQETTRRAWIDLGIAYLITLAISCVLLLTLARSAE